MGEILHSIIATLEPEAARILARQGIILNNRGFQIKGSETFGKARAISEKESFAQSSGPKSPARLSKGPRAKYRNLKPKHNLV